MNPGEERKREEKRGLGFCDGFDKNSITKETKYNSGRNRNQNAYC